MNNSKDIETTLFLGADNKLEELVNCLLKCPEGEKSYLKIVSCYFNCNSAKELIEIIRCKIDYLNLNIEIFIDTKTALAIGKQELCVWKEKVKEEPFKREVLKISIYVSYRKNQSNLFHPKAYCLVSSKKDGTNPHGSLVVGSANLTGRGLTINNGNVEILLDTQYRKHIKKFYKEIEKSDFIDIEDLDVCEFSDYFYDNYTEDFTEIEDENYSFYFRLLSLGYLVHPWKTNLSKPFKVVYSLKEQQNTKIKKEEPQLDKLLSSLKFTKKAQQKTITKDYTLKG